ncbi:MAG: protein translocase subunit SecA [Myxococcales bacterium]
MIQALVKKIFGTKNDRELKRMRPMVQRINELEPAIQGLSDADLKGQTARFRERLGRGEALDALLPEAFATVREASRRTLGMRHYDVQLIGGMVLHNGTIAEMKTGEGKTLVATLPVYLNALEGRGVHLITVNDYLAKRDAEWMGRIYNYLGMSVGVIVHDLTDRERQVAYGSDITYGQNNEFGFDYLRDNMKFTLESYVQRELRYAIVDEVDSILIDEARTPLIISGQAEKSTDMYYKVNDLIRPFKRDQDFVVDEKAHTCTLTEMGVDKVERKMSLENLYAPENMELLHHIHQALKAHTLFKRDINYLVENNGVIIIDEHTGRKMSGRRWSDGLHQAVEAKEGVPIQNENQTLATVTFQNYFRMYDKLAGMTGTADTEAEEFAKIYNLDVLVIPTNRPVSRKDDEDVVYTKERAKVTAIIDQIVEAHQKGQPVLVGTTSVEKSDFIGSVLKKQGIPCNILNAKYHEREATIIAQAGRKGAITIATNMAGRGTDILLGGNPDMMAKQELGTDEGPEYEALVASYREICAGERVEVLAAGGLYIIGTERHESRRIDNQLRGRAGRQGDPGKSSFFLSLEDDLLRIFGGDRLQKWMERLNVPDDEPIVHSWVTRSIEGAQKKVEGRNFDIRKNLLEYDDVMNQQRRTIYDLRRRVLDGKETLQLIDVAIEDAVDGVAAGFCAEHLDVDEWDMAGLEEAIQSGFKQSVSLEGTDRKVETIVEQIAGAMKSHYRQKREQIVQNLYRSSRYEIDEKYKIAAARADAEGKEIGELKVDEERLLESKRQEWEHYERVRYLQAIDTLWRDHLQAMDHLREGVHLHAYAQKDPKLIYKQEAYDMFVDLVRRVRGKVVETLFLEEVRSEAEIEAEIEARRKQAERLMDQIRVQHAEAGAAASGQAQQQAQQAAQRHVPVVRQRPKVGRNDPCYCGSGKKYKKCHLAQDEAEDQQAMSA